MCCVCIFQSNIKSNKQTNIINFHHHLHTIYVCFVLFVSLTHLPSLGFSLILFFFPIYYCPVFIDVVVVFVIGFFSVVVVSFDVEACRFDERMF